MTSIQERLQMKRIPLDKWSTKEKLCLASAVACSGDQNWMSVSRSLKMLCGANRPSDWFSQKYCAAQYGKLLENVETPKRKKRNERDGTSTVETPGESIMRKFTQERVVELKKLIQEEAQQFQKVKEDIILITSGVADEAKIREMWKQIELENVQKEKEKQQHVQWLKEREERKMEVDRALKNPLIISSPSQSPKTLINLTIKKEEPEVDDVGQPKTQQTATSPLLTSLLKSTVPTTTFIQSTSRANSSPTITNLLTGGAPTTIITTTGMQNAYIIQKPMENQNIPVFQTAPTLTKLLDPRQPIMAIEGTSLQTMQPMSSSSNEVELMETDGDQLLDVFENLNPDLIDDLADMLEDNNQIMLSDDILENVMQLTEGDALKNEEPAETSGNVQQEVQDENQPQIEQNSEILEDVHVEEKVEPIIEEIKVEVIPIEDSSPESKDIDNETLSTETEQEEKSNEEVKLVHDEQSLTSDEVFEDEAIVLSDESPKEEKMEPEMKTEEIEVKQEEVAKIEEEEAPIELMVKEETMEEEELVEELPNDVKESMESIDEKTEMELLQDTDSQENEELVKFEQQIEDEDEETIENIEAEVQQDIEKDKLSAKEIKIEETPEEEEYIDAKETLEEAENKDSDDLESKKSSSDVVAITDTDDDSLIEVIKEDKIGKAKRDYSRKKPDDSSKKEESPVKTDEAGEKRLLRRTLRDRDRSESPLVMVEDILDKRRYSTTPVIDSIPSSPASSEDHEYKVWKKTIMGVHNKLSLVKYASIFLRPVPDEQSAEYKNIIFRPMDLQTIKKNIDNGSIKTTAEFQRDVMLMCQNAIMFNTKDTNTQLMAREMMQEAIHIIESAFDIGKPSKDKDDRSGSSKRGKKTRSSVTSKVLN